MKKEYPKYIDNYTLRNKLHRLAWNIICMLLFRPFSLPVFNWWRNWILRMMGAEIGRGSIVHSSARIWAPWNLQIGQRTCIGPHTIIYNPGKIVLGSCVCISQYAYLCTATHDYTLLLKPLYWRDIIINDYAWVAARAFVGPGVTIGEGAIIGATASVYKDVEPWTVVGGNPARFIKRRDLRNE